LLLALAKYSYLRIGKNSESVALLVARRTNNQRTIRRLRVRGLLK